MTLTPDNRFFQYKLFLETLNSSYTPYLQNTSFTHSGPFNTSTNSTGHYSYNLTTPEIQGTYPIKVNLTFGTLSGSQTANISFITNNLSITASLNPSTAYTGNNVIVSGIVSFTNGTTPNGTEVNIYQDGTALTASSFSDDSVAEFSLGNYTSTMLTDGGNISLEYYFGDGSDGALTISSSNTIVNNYTQLIINVLSGNSTIFVNSTTNFSAGD